MDDLLEDSPISGTAPSDFRVTSLESGICYGNISSITMNDFMGKPWENRLTKPITPLYPNIYPQYLLVN